MLAKQVGHKPAASALERTAIKFKAFFAEKLVYSSIGYAVKNHKVSERPFIMLTPIRMGLKLKRYGNFRYFLSECSKTEAVLLILYWLSGLQFKSIFNFLFGKKYVGRFANLGELDIPVLNDRMQVLIVGQMKNNPNFDLDDLVKIHIRAGEVW